MSIEEAREALGGVHDSDCAYCMDDPSLLTAECDCPAQQNIDMLVLEVKASMPCYEAGARPGPCTRMFPSHTEDGEPYTGPLCPSCTARQQLAARKVEA